MKAFFLTLRKRIKKAGHVGPRAIPARDHTMFNSPKESKQETHIPQNSGMQDSDWAQPWGPIRARARFCFSSWSLEGHKWEAKGLRLAKDAWQKRTHQVPGTVQMSTARFRASSITFRLAVILSHVGGPWPFRFAMDVHVEQVVCKCGS